MKRYNNRNCDQRFLVLGGSIRVSNIYKHDLVILYFYLKLNNEHSEPFITQTAFGNLWLDGHLSEITVQQKNIDIQ